MADQPPDPKEKQIERARRLRKQIGRLKEGRPRNDEGNEPQDDEGKEQGKSLKEQIQEREAEQKKPTDTDTD